MVFEESSDGTDSAASLICCSAASPALRMAERLHHIAPSPGGK